MMYVAWKVLGTLRRFHGREKYASQDYFHLLIFALSSDTSTNPYFPL